MRIAIYEPDPRICGPASWASYMREGFRRLGHECHVVAFTNKGKRAVKWGRVERESGLVSSCTLVPDRVERYGLAGETLDQYDLIVLTDIKCPSHDKKAYDECEPWPMYVETLLQTKTPWTSALHGRLYFEPHEKNKHPELVTSDELRGSPFLAELLELENFSGFLIDHCVDDRFVTYSERLKKITRVHLPLPYVLSVTDDEIQIGDSGSPTTCVLGRVTQIKFRHLLNELLFRGQWPWPAPRILYGGAASTTWGPSESYELYEQLVGSNKRGMNAGWEGEREKGVRSSTVWRAWNSQMNAQVEYMGAYEHPREIGLLADIHVGITDHWFSGGICEFSTMEAIDCGCVPVISEPFDAKLGLKQVVIPRAFHGYGVSTTITSRDKPEKYPEVSEMLNELREALLEARELISVETVRHNRDVLATRCDPSIHAQAFLEGAL